MGKGSRKMKASELDEKQYPNFPELIDFNIPLNFIDAEVVLKLQELREMFGFPILPSPIEEGWARKNGSKDSQHYAVDRLSTAGDIFPERGYIIDCWLTAQQIPEIMGLGLYLDTNGIDGNFWPMMHFDLRKTSKRVFWIRENGKYYYLKNHFWHYFNKLVNIDKEFRDGTRTLRPR